MLLRALRLTFQDVQMLKISVTFLSALLLGACSSTTPRTALDVVKQAAEDIRSGNPQAASALLTDSARARGVAWPSSIEPTASPVEMRRATTWKLSTKEIVHLVHDEQGWRINAGVLRFLDSATPKDALRKFARSILGADYELLLELLPKTELKVWGPGQLMRALERDEIKRAWRAMAEMLERGQYALKCVEHVGECTVRLKGGHSIEMRMESKTWKVVDIRPSGKYIPGQSRGEASD